MFMSGAVEAPGHSNINLTAMPVFFYIILVVLGLMIQVMFLNALIAFLSDVFANVQSAKTAKKNRQKAELIVEYMDCLEERQLMKLQTRSCWTHELVPRSALIKKNVWQGPYSAIKELMVEHETKLNSKIERLQRRLLTTSQRHQSTARLANIARDEIESALHSSAPSASDVPAKNKDTAPLKTKIKG